MMKITTLGAGAITEALGAGEVIGDTASPRTTLVTGANDGLGRALVAPPNADATSVTGRLCDGEHEARANPQTYDEHTRQTLRAFSLQLIAPNLTHRSEV